MGTNHVFWRFIWIAGGLIAVLCVRAVIGALAGCNSPLASELGKEIAKSNGCFEFWVNRYQTLGASVIALVAAGTTVLAMLRQNALAQRQIDIAMGDVDPDFVLVPAFIIDKDPGGIRDLRIEIQNWNRRKLRIRKITVTSGAIDGVWIYKGANVVPGCEGATVSDIDQTVDRCNIGQKIPGDLAFDLRFTEKGGLAPGSIVNIDIKIDYAFDTQPIKSFTLSERMSAI